MILFLLFSHLSLHVFWETKQELICIWSFLFTFAKGNFRYLLTSSFGFLFFFD